jgi:hypothetical protein
MNIGPFEVLVLLFLVGNIVALVVCAMKERWVLFVLGLLFAVPAWIGALLSARPGSTWERRKQRTAAP